MTTEKFMGRHSLLKRLSAQVGSEESAKRLLIERGHMTADGKLTPAGEERDAMTAEERAKDRASKRSGAPVKVFKYDPKTNTARRR